MLDIVNMMIRIHVIIILHYYQYIHTVYTLGRKTLIFIKLQFPAQSKSHTIGGLTLTGMDFMMGWSVRVGEAHLVLMH